MYEVIHSFSKIIVGSIQENRLGSLHEFTGKGARLGRNPASCCLLRRSSTELKSPGGWMRNRPQIRSAAPYRDCGTCTFAPPPDLRFLPVQYFKGISLDLLLSLQNREK